MYKLYFQKMSSFRCTCELLYPDLDYCYLFKDSLSLCKKSRPWLQKIQTLMIAIYPKILFAFLSAITVTVFRFSGCELIPSHHCKHCHPMKYMQWIWQQFWLGILFTAIDMAPIPRQRQWMISTAFENDKLSLIDFGYILCSWCKYN